MWDNRKDVVNEYIDYFRKKDIRELNIEDPNGFAPIHYAAKFNLFEIMKILIDTEKLELEDEERQFLNCSELCRGSGKRVATLIPRLSPGPPPDPSSLCICHYVERAYRTSSINSAWKY